MGGPFYPQSVLSPFVVVSSVKNSLVLEAVKCLDLDSFDSLTRSRPTYPRHDDNWMKLGRACQHASALPSFFSLAFVPRAKLYQESSLSSLWLFTGSAVRNLPLLLQKTCHLTMS